MPQHGRFRRAGRDYFFLSTAKKHVLITEERWENVEEGDCKKTQTTLCVSLD